MEKSLLEYPRPQMVRDSFINLNGEWNCIIYNKQGLLKYNGKINVPYSPEAKLSGVNEKVLPNDTLIYNKYIKLDDSFIKDRVLLNFGAVDQICEIYINNELVYKHFGGYIPFSCDITDYIKDNGINIKLIVKDYTNKKELCRGKQSLNPGGINYQAQSGIWQTVWLESVPKKYIKYFKITPDIDNNCFLIKVKTNIKDKCIINFQDKEYIIDSDVLTKIPVDNPIYWDIDNPYLYDVSIKCGEDKVDTYFGYRKIELKNEDGQKYIYLNNKKVFLKGILEQGYYKDGLYTPDSYDTVENDIKLIKECGFNTIRKHIKIEPARYYYLCDKLGMFVIQDMINGGGIYNPFVVILPLIVNCKLKDHHHVLLARRNKRAKEIYEYELKNMIASLYNSPSIIMWTIFNEAWGQFDSKKMYDLVLSLDKSRLIDPASGWYNQGFGELRSDHNYKKKYNFKTDGRAVMLSEFGGLSLGKSKFTYKSLKDEISYLKAIKELLDRDVYPYIDKGLVGYVYTQYNDIEDECNGIVDVDRVVKSKQLKEVFNK